MHYGRESLRNLGQVLAVVLEVIEVSFESLKELIVLVSLDLRHLHFLLQLGEGRCLGGFHGAPGDVGGRVTSR